MADRERIEPVDDRESSPVPVDPDFTRLLEKLSESYAFDFREYKPGSLERRIRARMNQVHTDTFDAYLRFLDAHPDEHVDLFNTILINVTGFFRDTEAWTTLGEEIIPRLVGDAPRFGGLRIWSAGCSSGEETFSIAILLAEHLGARAADYQIKIYGTDVDEDALSAARQALYRVEQLKDVPDRLLDRYFTRDGQLWRVRRDIRRWCIFGSHNVTQSPPLSHIDLLVCRNVLIYFSSALQNRILSRLHYALRDGGYLFLGRSESLLTRSRLFSGVHLKWRIFQRTPADLRASAVLPETAASAMPQSRADTSGAPVERALEAVPAAVMVVDASDTIVAWNHAAETLFETPLGNALARKFRDLDVSYRVEGLRACMEEVKVRQSTARIDDVTFTRRSGDLVHATITITPLFEAARFIGVLIYVEDATEYARLKEQMTRIAEQHGTAIEELQSTNEELETTNEELQSTNEELETTNEELQSTNEELETTVEELQAANAELAALNAELEERGVELGRLDAYHRGVMDGLEQAVIVVDPAAVVRTWNKVAERMWGLRAEQATGRAFLTLPLGEMVRISLPVFEHVLADGHEAAPVRVPYREPGGAERHTMLKIVPVRDGATHILGGVAIAYPSDASSA